MVRHSRHEWDRKSWRALQDLEDDDLYAILGSVPTYQAGPRSFPEYLLIGVRFPKTREAIASGKKRFERFLRASRSEICKRWDSLKKHKRKLARASVVATVCEVVVRLVHLDPGLPVVPTADLICRLCGYNLDRLCCPRVGKGARNRK